MVAGEQQGGGFCRPTFVVALRSDSGGPTLKVEIGCDQNRAKSPNI
jgi:hypothetical protein